MKYLSRVVWSEGLFLRPQHFQQQERYLEAYVQGRAGGLRPNSWGLLELEIERDLLAIGKLGFPHDGLLFGLHFGEPCALGGDLITDLRKLHFKICRGGQRAKRALGLGFGGRCLLTAHVQPCARFGQRRQPCGLTIEIAFARSCFGFSAARGIEGGLRGGESAMFSFNIAPCDRKFAIDLNKPAALRETTGGTCWRVRCCNKPVPAPKVALWRDQALAGLERSCKPGPGVAVDP